MEPETMKALIYQGPGKRVWEEHSRPTINDTSDAIVKMVQTTICGTDLHIMKGDVPTVTKGRILGHEGVGVVEAVGSAVGTFKKNDRVIISCITACSKCDACKKGMPSHCEVGGWMLGNTIDGTQAEYVRIPQADTSLYAVPKGADEDALVMLSDILPTGFECGVQSGAVRPGDSVAIVGAGPIGLSALLTAQLYSPAEIIMIDLDENRLEIAKSLGATQVVSSRDGNAVERVMALTNQKGVDVAIEAVGLEVTFGICQDIVAVGGHIANIGVHGKSVELKLNKLWDRNVTITTRLVDAVTTPMLLKSVLSGRLAPRKLITHTFELGEMMKAYDTFEDAAKQRALKVILKAS
jgi:alcohol dehydrogenase